jgi:hypothetical protein
MRMTGRTRVGTVGGLLVVATLLAACGGGDDGPTGASTPSHGTAPTGTAVTIAPLADLDGASPVELAGVTLLVPDDLEQEPADAGEGVQQLVLREPGAERAAVILTVTEEPGATDAAVDASALVSETQLGASGEWTGITRSPAVWDGLPYAVAVSGTLGLADGTQRDALLVTTRDADGTRIVGISAEAAAGELEESVAYRVLRTLAVG